MGGIMIPDFGIILYPREKQTPNGFSLCGVWSEDYVLIQKGNFESEKTQEDLEAKILRKKVFKDCKTTEDFVIEYFQPYENEEEVFFFSFYLKEGVELKCIYYDLYFDCEDKEYPELEDEYPYRGVVPTNFIEVAENAHERPKGWSIEETILFLGKCGFKEIRKVEE